MQDDDLNSSISSDGDVSMIESIFGEDSTSESKQESKMKDLIPEYLLFAS